MPDPLQRRRLSTWLVVVATIVLLGGSGIALERLRAGVVTELHEQALLLRLRAEAAELQVGQMDSLVSGRHVGAVETTELARGQRTKATMRDQMHALSRRDHDAKTRRLATSLVRFLAQYDVQVRLLKAGEFERAELADRKKMDPEAAAFREALADKHAHQARVVVSTERLGRRGSIAVLVLTLAAILGLIWRFNRSQRAALEAAQAQTALELDNDKLKQLDLLKDDFVASVSHDLRTPLTSIRGYLELVRDGEAGELTAKQDEFLLVIERNTDRLLRLITDLLFVAQMDAGKLDLELAQCDLGALVEEAGTAMQPIADQRGITLELSAEALPPFEADASRLAQLIDNLLSNAIKFTPRGGRVAVTLRGEGDSAVLEIADSGIGIPADEQSRLFDRFFRASTATDSAIQGTGLGLSIAKAIVDAHEGKLTVESAPAVGTTFRAEFPLAGVPARVDDFEAAA